MNDDKLNITLRILGKPYEMGIDPQKEEIYRLAERKVNQHVNELKDKRTDGYSILDYLAIAAVDFAVSTISLSKSREIGSEELKRLAKLAQEVETHLNK